MRTALVLLLGLLAVPAGAQPVQPNGTNWCGHIVRATVIRAAQVGGPYVGPDARLTILAGVWSTDAEARAQALDIGAHGFLVPDDGDPATAQDYYPPHMVLRVTITDGCLPTGPSR